MPKEQNDELTDRQRFWLRHLRACEVSGQLHDGRELREPKPCGLNRSGDGAAIEPKTVKKLRDYYS